MVAGLTSTVCRYDGRQMGMEDVDTTGSASTVTDYGIGVRGVDYIASTKSGTTTVGFPIYDCHGSMTACLFRSGTTYYSLGNQRHYDAWGVIRSGANSGDPKGRYCANLGHKQDDESGLVYMRARYLEPASGRFVNEKDFYQAFMDRSSGIRDAVHREVSKMGLSEEEVGDEILYQAEKYETGISMETDAEIEGDVEAGVDMDEVLLEEEVLVIDTTTGE